MRCGRILKGIERKTISVGKILDMYRRILKGIERCMFFLLSSFFTLVEES